MIASFILLFIVSVCYLSFFTISGSWIDPDTPDDVKVVKSNVNGKSYNLVFSDEFDVEKRNFADGNDPRWTAMDKNDYTNYALHYYTPRLVTTTNGYLNITTVREDIHFSVASTIPGKKERLVKNYQSAMINGWNKFCFTGGIIEFNAVLPGKHNIGGLWPAMWLLGNLARSTYVGSSDNMWPWSFKACERRLQTSQEISGCGVEHHWDMEGSQGRGAPEIDILEAMPGKEILKNTPINKPYFSASLQVAPAMKYRPLTSFPPDIKQWYKHGLDYGKNSSLNIFFYGMRLMHTVKNLDYDADALSANVGMEETHFKEFHRYRLEWKSGENGYLKWYLDDRFLYSIRASALNETGAIIPEEPMYILLNTAMSSTWGFPSPCPRGCPCNCFDCASPECECAIPKGLCGNLPAHFLIDSVRVYQDTSDNAQTVGCSPPGHRTKKWIQGHPHRYMGEEDHVMMRPVPHGGGSCGSDGDCRNNGSCEKKKCVCTRQYTGPFCMAANGFDDIDWDPDYTPIEVSTFFVPRVLIALAVVVVGLLGSAVVYKYVYERDRRGNWRMRSMGQYARVEIRSPNIGTTYQSIN